MNLKAAGTRDAASRSLVPGGASSIFPERTVSRLSAWPTDRWNVRHVVRDRELIRRAGEVNAVSRQGLLIIEGCRAALRRAAETALGDVRQSTLTSSGTAGALCKKLAPSATALAGLLRLLSSTSDTRSIDGVGRLGDWSILGRATCWRPGAQVVRNSRGLARAHSNPPCGDKLVFPSRFAGKRRTF